jgi:hypothetical protein
VEVVVIDQRPALGPAQDQLALRVGLGLPDQRRSLGDENEEHALEVGALRTELFGTGMFGLVAQFAVLDRDSMFVRVGVDPAAEDRRTSFSQRSLGKRLYYYGGTCSRRARNPVGLTRPD